MGNTDRIWIHDKLLLDERMSVLEKGMAMKLALFGEAGTSLNEMINWGVAEAELHRTLIALMRMGFVHHQGGDHFAVKPEFIRDQQPEA